MDRGAQWATVHGSAESCAWNRKDLDRTGRLALSQLIDNVLSSHHSFSWTAQGLSHTYTRIGSPQSPLLPRLPRNTEQVSLC